MDGPLQTPISASGGMGVIYRGRDPQTGADIAIKMIHGNVERGRFAREIRILAELDDPAIVRYLGHGLADNGEPYMKMEWLEGETLAARLQRGPLSVTETVALARRVLGALATAHAAGIVHRDLKPSNIFLVDGRVDRAKVIDFGIARILSTGQSQTITRTGVAVGTPNYMSPEQARGSRLLDGRADLFALGSVIYECLAGWPAFSGTDEMQVMGRVLFEEPPALPLIPPAGLTRILASLLRKEPGARPSSAGQVLALLESATLEVVAEGSAAWFEERHDLVAGLAARCDHDGLLGVLCEAGMPGLDEPGRRSQLRCLADGTVALFELGLADLGSALATRVANLASALRLPDDESRALVAMVRGASAAARGDAVAALTEMALAAEAFEVAGDTAHHLAMRASIADLAAEKGELARALVEANAVLAAGAGHGAAQARARLALGTMALAKRNVADARMHLSRVPADWPWLRGRALVALARAALRSGHAAVAEKEARAAAAALEQLPHALADAQAVLGQALARQKKTGQAFANAATAEVNAMA